MLFLSRFLLLCSAAFSISVAAQDVPRVGQEYLVLDRPQPTEAGKKVEVIEFFGYFCGGCNVFEPFFEDWIKKQGDRIVVKRIHSSMQDIVTQQKLYFTLEAMGIVDAYQLKVFNAYHVDRNRLSTDEQVMQFVEKQGIDKKKFFDIYNSFTIISKLNRTKQLEAAYKLGSVPTVVIDGRFVVSPLEVASKSNSSDRTPRAGTVVMDWLVDKVFKEKNGATPPVTQATLTKK